MLSTVRYGDATMTWECVSDICLLSKSAGMAAVPTLLFQVPAAAMADLSRISDSNLSLIANTLASEYQGWADGDCTGDLKELVNFANSDRVRGMSCLLRVARS